jgi:hypothetical protein
MHDAYDGSSRRGLRGASTAVGDYLAPTLGQAAPAYQPAYLNETEVDRKPLK